MAVWPEAQGSLIMIGEREKRRKLNRQSQPIFSGTVVKNYLYVQGRREIPDKEGKSVCFLRTYSIKRGWEAGQPNTRWCKTTAQDFPDFVCEVSMTLPLRISFSENEEFKSVQPVFEGVLAASVAGFSQIC